MPAIAVFQSHPIQHFSPLWKEIVSQGNNRLKVYYYSRHGLEASEDPDFGCEVKWDVDLLKGYESEFLPRAWPTRSALDCSWRGLNRGLARAVRAGWNVAYISGYRHLNHWRVAALCNRYRVPLLYHSDSNAIHERRKPPLWRSLKRLAVGRFFRRVTLFLATGDHNADYLRMYGAPADRISFCPIPVDLPRFEQAVQGFGETERRSLRAQYSLRSSDFVVGFCSKMAPHKRPQDLIDAAETCGLDDLRILFIGSGELEAQLRSRNSPHARFAGFINQTAIPRLLAACDLLAMPSERDAHPLAVTEAQTLGLPVLLSDRCGCYGPNDVFRDGESGILYPCGDIAALAKAIKVLHGNPDKRQEMGARGRELARSHSATAAARKFVEAVARATQLSTVACG